jgi:hypothetical protein
MVPTARRDWIPGGIQSVLPIVPLAGWTAGRPAPSRFNPAASGRIAGSVAARRTYEEGLAASGPDGTRVLVLPALFDNGMRVTR